MPTFDLRTTSSIDLLGFDIIGECRSSNISHVAIGTSTQANVRHGERIRVVHMQPPLSENGDMVAHVIGRMSLQNQERRTIRNWLNEQVTALADVSPRKQYHLRSRSSIDPATNVETPCFSCATFVQACFDEAIDVRLVDEDRVPASSRETLSQVWGPDWVRLGRFFGLAGEGPWPILLPAHLLHALDRDDPRAAPYVPREDDWDFPRPAPP
jgi:hypothetical protein